ncbi:LAMI_0E00408g1_1 [Lachancea mirantina]|uniref:Ubiquitin-like modifier-activating enzyme ATG7 n=1 Tax=Lachancea mirantina TaxID=1230905 RepID=A0A1G4JIT9_9SACH|nr:LAMI_0E00408g1_1 [Lachancea mirantina]
MSETQLKFCYPFISFIDISFFQELARLKLEVFKLDTELRSLYSTINCNHRDQSSQSGHLFLDSQSFDAEGSSKDVPLSGSLLNFNTLEDFRDFDKTKFLNEKARTLFEQGLKDPNHCIQFFMLSFADLKKYKFYHWICAPSFQMSDTSLLVNRNEFIRDVNKFDMLAGHLQNKWIGFLDKNENYLGDQWSVVNDASAIMIRDTSFAPQTPSAFAKNLITLVAHQRPKLETIRVYFIRNESDTSYWLRIQIKRHEGKDAAYLKTSGWERNVQNKLIPKLTDLNSLVNPTKLAEQSVDLNLKLMKWRIAPELDLDSIKSCRVLLLGAGTLGCYVARTALAWGVRKITFVDNSTVSLSNPVRQSLYKFDSHGKPKAAEAALALKEIAPMVDAAGYNLEIPMIGHPVRNEIAQHRDYDELVRLIKEHDAVFLLMDSRETRWLPTVLGYAENKTVINAALGFDSYLVMRHGTSNCNDTNMRLGCYFCNDVVAPSDSLRDRTLDQMCTVTRPGVALMASSQSVELLVSLLQHPLRANCTPDDVNVLGSIPHQIRGFLNEFKTLQLRTPAYVHCSACSSAVVDKLKTCGWDFVRQAMNNYKYVEDLSGLSEVQDLAEKAASSLVFTSDDEYEDDVM